MQLRWYCLIGSHEGGNSGSIGLGLVLVGFGFRKSKNCVSRFGRYLKVLPN